MELPDIRGYASSSSIYQPTSSFTATGNTILDAQPTTFLERRMDALHTMHQANQMNQLPKRGNVQKEPVPMSKRRLVQVYIADADENLPLEHALIYKGEQKFTDLDNNELFHEIAIKELLDRHNQLRSTIINKKVKERVEHLEPVRIRDLKMVVVEIAAF